MNERIKSRLVLILALSNVIFLLAAVSSCGSSRKQFNAWKKEMAARLDSEEKMSKFMSEKTILEDRSSKLSASLEEEKSSHESTKKSLMQEQLINQSLKVELEKINKLKLALEEDLKEALVSGKTEKPKK